MKLTSILPTVLALSAPLSFNALAANDMARHESSGEMKTSNAAAAMSSGEVKKVDKQAGKITIKHGPLTNLGMPGMTMVFRVKDPAMLDQVKAGDKIAFIAEKSNGMFTVTKLEPAR